MKSLKRILSVVIAFVCVFTFTACKTKVSATTTDMSKTVYNGFNTNGGITIVHDGYLYFVNGTKTNDGTSATKNTISAVCRVKIDEEGVIDESTYEVVVDNLVGYDNGSIAIFGDYLYFATPNNDVNYQDVVLYYQTKFMRYDLVNKKSYLLYTTEKNSSSESISYSYYINENSLNLVVYESAAAKITSLKIDTEVKTNYVIKNVGSCVLSENYGKSESEAAVDANNFVFYTKTTDVYNDGISGGTIVYKTSATTDDSAEIYNGSKSVSILSIKAGKLIYSSKSVNGEATIIYYQAISASKTEPLDFKYTISYSTYDNIVFFGNDDGTISAICMDSETDEVLLLQTDKDNPYVVNQKYLYKLSITASSSSSSSSSSEQKDDVSFIGVETVTITETEGEGDDATEKDVEVTYLFYVLEKAIYKLEIYREGVLTSDAEQIKLSKSTASSVSGNMVPEIIDGYIYFFAKEVDKNEKDTNNVYLHRVDLSIDDDATEFATAVAKKEKK